MADFVYFYIVKLRLQFLLVDISVYLEYVQKTNLGCVRLIHLSRMPNQTTCF
jgi:hypothetical protein